MDVLRRRGAFFSHDFGLSRTGSSSAVHSRSLDSLHSSPGTSSFSAWALGLRWNGLKPLGPSGPTITPQNHAPSSSDREENFDILGPKSWPVESCFPMGARVSSATHGTLLTFWRSRCIVINAFFLGIMRITSVYKMCIQWRLYEAAWIWKLEVPLGIGRELFCLTFFL